MCRLMNGIKALIKRNRHSENIVLRAFSIFLTKVWDFLYSAKKYCSDPEYRSIQLIKLFHGGFVHQTSAVTCMNRYPDTFLECSRYFGNNDRIRLLSFGCSTGEEVLTLREYFPNAEIVGADINKRNLKACRKLKTDGRISFVYSSPKNLKRLGTFDAIFCMAVFQRTPHYIAESGISDISEIYPFEKFENQIAVLGEMVKPKGLLVVHFSQYSFEDTRIASKFTSLNDHRQRYYGLPVFDKHGQLDTDSPPYHSIFVKNIG